MVPLEDVSVKLVTDIETAWECSRWLSTCKRVAVDTETTGLSPHKDHIRLVSIGDADTAYVVPTDVTRAGVRRQTLGWGGFIAELLDKFANTPGNLIDMHNAKYDHAMIDSTFGLYLPRHIIHDTRFMSHVLDSKGSLGLKQIASKIVDPRAALGQDILDSAMKTSGWTWATIPIDFKPYWFYAGLDVILTSRVRTILEPIVQRESLKAYELERAVAWPCSDMELRGVTINRPYTEQFLDRLERHADEVKEWCKYNYGVDAGSDMQITNKLLDDGVELIKRTKSGARYSVDKEVLSTLDHPLAKAVLARRNSVKTSGYLRGYLELAGDDNLIHPSINTVGGIANNPFDSGGCGSGVRTGRMSCSSPNLQNVPTRTPEGAAVRKCFVPRQGRKWIKVDADQIESRILASLSGDPGMIQAFKDASDNGGDFFVNVARMIYGDPDFQKSDPRRSIVKNAMYAKAYGAGVSKFAWTAKIPIEEAATFMRKYDTMFEGVPRFINTVQATARARHASEGEAYVRSSYTGRKHVADIHKLYPIVNYLIQGLAAELLKAKLIQADMAGLGKYMLFPVHDEIDLDVPTELVPDVLRTVRETMNDNKLLKVPLTWSANTGPSWGECKD